MDSAEPMEPMLGSAKPIFIFPRDEGRSIGEGFAGSQGSGVGAEQRRERAQLMLRKNAKGGHPAAPIVPASAGRSGMACQSTSTSVPDALCNRNRHTPTTQNHSDRGI